MNTEIAIMMMDLVKVTLTLWEGIHPNVFQFIMQTDKGQQ